MTINLVPENFTRIENVNQGTLLYNEDKFIGMNIFDHKLFNPLLVSFFLP